MGEYDDSNLLTALEEIRKQLVDTETDIEDVSYSIKNDLCDVIKKNTDVLEKITQHLTEMKEKQNEFFDNISSYGEPPYGYIRVEVIDWKTDIQELKDLQRYNQ